LLLINSHNFTLVRNLLGKLELYLMLRIASGQFKGRQLKAPPSTITRPVTGLFRKSIFDSCQSAIEDAVVADLFAGSGILGLEALSRGAKKAYFIEKDRKAIDVIEQNIALLGVKSKSQLIKGDFFRHFTKIPDKIDVAFLDPPYTIGLEGYLEILSLLMKEEEKFSQEAHIFFELSSKFATEIENRFAKPFTIHRVKKSSTTTLLHLRKKLE